MSDTKQQSQAQQRNRNIETIVRLLTKHKLSTPQINLMTDVITNVQSLDYYTALSTLGLVSDEIVAELIAELYNVRYVPKQEALEIMDISEEIKSLDCWSFNCVPIRCDNNQILLGLRNPDLKLESVFNTIEISGYTYELAVLGNTARERIFDLCVDLRDLFRRAIQRFNQKLKLEGPHGANAGDLLRDIIETGVIIKASDMLFWGTEEYGLIAVKVNGSVRQLGSLDKVTYDRITVALTSLLQISKDYLIAQPHSGYLTFKDSTSVLGDYNLRTETSIPDPMTMRGVISVTIRLLPKRTTLLSLSDLGYSETERQDVVRRAIHSSGAGGLVVIAGPTNSGKTTSLHAILSEVDACTKYIKEIAAPVEYKRSMFEQISITGNNDQEFLIHSRSMVRKAPDILVLGEMRSYSELEFAINMCLSGTVILTTMHASSVVTAIERLIHWSPPGKDLSKDLASVINMLIAQRLIRTLCTHCKLPEDSEHTLNEITKSTGQSPAAGMIFKAKSSGCEKCSFTGHANRVLLTERITKNKKVTEFIMQREYHKLTEHMLEQEQSLWQQGAKMIFNGSVSYDELCAQCHAPDISSDL